MINFSLSEEQQLLQKTARDFARKEIRPVADAIHWFGAALAMPSKRLP
jgi:alkylation response protein AidB-like acyl-CoA dehydrogenase